MQTPRGGCGDNSPVIVVWEICKHGRNIMFNERSFRGNGKHWTHKKRGKKRSLKRIKATRVAKEAKNKTASGEAGAVWQCDVGKLHRSWSKLWILRLIHSPHVSASKKAVAILQLSYIKKMKPVIKEFLESRSNSSEGKSANAVQRRAACESMQLQNIFTMP